MLAAVTSALVALAALASPAAARALKTCGGHPAACAAATIKRPIVVIPPTPPAPPPAAIVVVPKACSGVPGGGKPSVKFEDKYLYVKPPFPKCLDSNVALALTCGMDAQGPVWAAYGEYSKFEVDGHDKCTLTYVPFCGACQGEATEVVIVFAEVTTEVIAPGEHVPAPDYVPAAGFKLKRAPAKACGGVAVNQLNQSQGSVGAQQANLFANTGCGGGAIAVNQLNQQSGEDGAQQANLLANVGGGGGVAANQLVSPSATSPRPGVPLAPESAASRRLSLPMPVTAEPVRRRGRRPAGEPPR